MSERANDASAHRPVALPASGSGSPGQEWEDVASLVIIGANGSGKSRLGAWIEDHPPSGRAVHRIAAQRALSVPEVVPPKNERTARVALMYGRDNAQPSQKTHIRWNKGKTTSLLNDFAHLLALLFAQEGTRNKAHVEKTREVNGYVPVPESNSSPSSPMTSTRRRRP